MGGTRARGPGPLRRAAGRASWARGGDGAAGCARWWWCSVFRVRGARLPAASPPPLQTKAPGRPWGERACGPRAPRPAEQRAAGGRAPVRSPGAPFLLSPAGAAEPRRPAGPVPGSPRVSRARPRPQRSEEELAPGRALPRAAEEGGSLPLLLPHPPVNKNKRPRACRTRDAGEPRVR